MLVHTSLLHGQRYFYSEEEEGQVYLFKNVIPNHEWYGGTLSKQE